MGKTGINIEALLSDKLDFLLAYFYEEEQNKGLGAPFSFIGFIDTKDEVFLAQKRKRSWSFTQNVFLIRII